MISFIVIGQNEGKNLRRCFNSIYETVFFNSLINYEIIYVDSKSTDNSIEIAKTYKDIKIYSLTGNCNAAIARNAGAKEAVGKVLFFIDADMEINKRFLSSILNHTQESNFSLVTGEVIDIVDGCEEKKRENFNFPFLSGGIFLIRKELWDLMDGMKTKYLNGEDPDLGLRLIKKGISVSRKNEIITKHYTVPYYNRTRIWRMLFNRSFICTKCVLYRDHILNKNMYRYLFLFDKTLILFIFLTILSIVLPSYILFFIIFYLIIVVLRSIKQVRYITIAEQVLFFVILDILNFICLFTFFPKNPTVKYIRIHQ